MVGLALGAAVLLVLGAGFWIYVATRQSHVPLDPQTYCPESGPRAVTAVLIDATDPINLVQRTDLLNELEKLLDTIPRHGALDIYTVGPVAEEPPQPLFHRCNPGRAAEISELTGNPVMVERDWREGFRKPVETVLAQVLAPGEADSSPILESIQWVTINALTAPGRADVPRRLVIVSDFLQHTSGLSLYRSAAAFARFADTPYYRRVRAPLKDVMIDMFVVQRDTRRGAQGPALLDFWKEYFDAQGARGLRIVELAG